MNPKDENLALGPGNTIISSISVTLTYIQLTGSK